MKLKLNHACALAAAALTVAAPVASARPAQPVRDSILLRGTPVGGPSEKYEDVTLNFFLDRTGILGRDVTATVAGHRTKVKHVGGKTAFYVGALAHSVHLRWSRAYTVTIQVRHGRTFRYRVWLPRPAL
jgi:hypothetical protein